MKLQTVFYLLLLIIGNNVYAQSCDSVCIEACIENDLSPSGIMIGHEHPKGMWKFSYRYMSMMMENNLFGTQAIDDNAIFNNYIMAPESMHMDMHMLMGMYGITDRLSLMGMLNYNVLSMKMNMFPVAAMNMPGMNSTSNTADDMTSKTAGFGDMQLYAVYEVLQKNCHSLFLSAGANIPSGSIYVKGKSNDMMYPSLRLPYMMQLGSGTLDFLPGVTYLMRHNKLSASAQVASVIRPFNNSLNYSLGNELNLNGWIAYKWINWMSTSFRMEDRYTSMISGMDTQLMQTMEPSASPFNYGGQTVSAFVGLNFYINKSFLRNSKLSVEYGIPAYRFVNGVQMALKSWFYAGWMISF